MKSFLLLALCALFAGTAGARTLYVDARRPNNNGNGFSAKQAKKTIQAAINIATAGDTILVAPGSYAPIKTNNKKITIKSTKGATKTTIVKSTKESENVALAQLGKTSSYIDSEWVFQKVSSSKLSLTSAQREEGYYVTEGGTYRYYPKYGVKKNSYPRSSGTATKLTGFLLDGMKRAAASVVGVSGGTVSACVIQRLGLAKTYTITTSDGTYTYTFHTDVQAAYKSKLIACTIKNNVGPSGSNLGKLGGKGALLSKCEISRCKITGNKMPGLLGSGGPGGLFFDCTAYNTLIAKNSATFRWGASLGEAMLGSSQFLNCTIADNTMIHDKTDAKFAAKSKFYNCILRNNYSQRKDTEWVANPATGTYESKPISGAKMIHNVDSGNTYKNTDKTNKNPKLTADYKLKKGSYAIDKGRLTSSQKKNLGATDLAGDIRIRGKAIDRGCYER